MRIKLKVLCHHYGCMNRADGVRRGYCKKHDESAEKEAKKRKEEEAKKKQVGMFDKDGK